MTAALVLPTLPSCGRAATVQVEVYSPRDGHAHGSLDADVYACAEHVFEIMLALDKAGLTPYQTLRTPAARRCGDVWDYDTCRLAPAPAKPADQAAVADLIAGLIEQHKLPKPAACNYMSGYEGMSKPLPPIVAVVVDDAAGVRAWAEQLGPESLSVEVRQDGGEILRYVKARGQLLGWSVVVAPLHPERVQLPPPAPQTSGMLLAAHQGVLL